MNYINIKTNEYPVFEVHIVNRNKGFDDYKVVFNSEIPQYDKVTQMCVEVSPTKTMEDYFRSYKIVDKSDAQIAKEYKASVPSVITPRQLRLALLEATLLDEVEAMVVTNRAMGIWWEYSLDIKRNNKYIISAGLDLNLTEKQVDDLFIGASKL